MRKLDIEATANVIHQTEGSHNTQYAQNEHPPRFHTVGQTSIAENQKVKFRQK